MSLGPARPAVGHLSLTTCGMTEDTPVSDTRSHGKGFFWAGAHAIPVTPGHLGYSLQ